MLGYFDTFSFVLFFVSLSDIIKSDWLHRSATACRDLFETYTLRTWQGTTCHGGSVSCPTKKEDLVWRARIFCFFPRTLAYFPRMNFPEKELETLQKWQANDIFKKTLAKDSPKGPFVFFEGPPTANGKPGIHHAEARAFKDCIPRFRTMQGYRVLRKGGWDTHGLAVEIEVEKQLGFTGKAQIEEYGIDKFNAKCQESVWTYKKDWEEFTTRLGYWVDLENAYITYKPEYIESLWWIVKQIWDKGLLYKDYRVTPHCPRCGTSLSSHELAQGYKDVKDLAVTVKFKLKGPGVGGRVPGDKEYILAWTTTPWTLPGNVALAVGNDIDYVKIKRFVLDQGVAHVELGDELPVASGHVEYLWLAKDRLDIVEKGYEVVEEVKGEKLVGMAYEPLYPFLRAVILSASKDPLRDPSSKTPQDDTKDDTKVDTKVDTNVDTKVDTKDDKSFTIVPAKFVTTADGTGVVHTAVMYGQDDFELGQQVGLPKHHLVNFDGTFLEGMDFLSGRFVVDEEVAIDIIKDLAHRGLLFSKAKYEHSYPHCWRCKTKVIYYAKDSWYIRMSDLRGELLKHNDNIHWEPEHIKDGRFGEWLREVKDWAFSRERYWGTPLPIWECTGCENKKCVGSFAELRDPSSKTPQDDKDFDPHRPFVDAIELPCEKCSSTMKRVPDVCDVWFDSGCMPFAQWHYPFENKELVDSGEAFPADYISEAIDQTRGWFYTLLAVSTLLGKERSFKNVICLGHVLDAEGKKMSKSLGNIVKPMEMFEKYGADAVRWYMYTINQPGESKRFDEKALGDMVKKHFGILMNVVSFFEMFVGKGEEVEEGKEVERTHVLDRWILARLHKITKQTTERLEAYVITETVRDLGEFVQDLSTWYVRRSRDRFKSTDADDKNAAIATLKECLLTLSKLIAPFAPFLAESVYEQAGGKSVSVHLEAWPIANEALIDEAILEEMGRTRSIVSRSLERRSEAGINVRQALASAIVTIPSGQLAQEYIDVIQDEINVKVVTIQKGDYQVELDLVLTPELVREGTVREIIRRVNALRKESGLTIEDRIELYVDGPAEVKQAIEEHKDTLLFGTLSNSLRTQGDVPEKHEQFRANEFAITIGIVVN